VNIEDYLRKVQGSTDKDDQSSFELFGKTTKGKIHFRGLKLNGKWLENIAFTNCDFSESSFLDCRFINCVFAECTFKKVRFDKTRDYGCEFSRCAFEKCKFKDYSFGYRGSSYQTCRYSNCDFRGAAFIKPFFEHCDFDNCRLVGLDFNASSFEYVNFSSQLIDCWFRNGFWADIQKQEFGDAKENTMNGVSFLNGSLRAVAFSGGCNLLDVVLPSSGNYLLIENRKALKERLSRFLCLSTRDPSIS